MRRVPPVEHEHVPVRVLEDPHVADAGVERLAAELDALRLELLLRRRDVGTRSAIEAVCGPVNELPMFSICRR